jgi:DNA-directed RNA polymerase specialized sigma24 family protein
VSQWPEDIAEDVDDLVRITSSSITKRYWKHVPAGDVRQAIEEHAWRNKSKICSYLRDENRRAGWAAASKALHRAGDRYARKAKADRLGYNARDEFFYDKILVSEVIRYSVSGVAPVPDEEAGYIRAPRDPAEGGNLNAMLADITGALSLLDIDDATLLVDRYGDDRSPEEMGKERGVSRQAIESRLDRVLLKVINLLGGQSPY